MLVLQMLHQQSVVCNQQLKSRYFLNTTNLSYTAHMTGVVKGSAMGNCIKERCQVVLAVSQCMVFLLNFMTLGTHLYVQLL